jgi:hypothetical protein
MTSGSGTEGGTGRTKPCRPGSWLCLLAGTALLAAGCRSGSPEAGARQTPSAEPSAADIARPASPEAAPPPSADAERMLEEMVSGGKGGAKGKDTDTAKNDRQPPGQPREEIAPGDRRSDADLEDALQVLARAGGEGSAAEAGAAPKEPLIRGGAPPASAPADSTTSTRPAPTPEGPTPAAAAPGAPASPPPAAAPQTPGGAAGK